MKYGERGHGGASLESREIGRWIAGTVPSEQTVFHWGAEPGVHFWSGRPTEYRFVYNYPLFHGPRRDEFLGDLLAQLSCDPPEVVVLNVAKIGRGDPVSLFLESHYVAALQPFPMDFFEIWSLREKAPEC